jgi:hypothetical protein
MLQNNNGGQSVTINYLLTRRRAGCVPDRDIADSPFMVPLLPGIESAFRGGYYLFSLEGNMGI